MQSKRKHRKWKALTADAAVTKNMDYNKSNPEDHECTSENHIDDPDHCGNMGDAGSMMGTKYKASAL